MAKKKESYSVKAEKLVAAYAGDIREAAEAIGMTYKNALQLIHRHNLRPRMQVLNENICRELLSGKEERLALWAAIMRGDYEDDVSMADRLKASQLLGKACGDFPKTVKVEGGASPLQHQVGVKLPGLEDRVKNLLRSVVKGALQ